MMYDGRARAKMSRKSKHSIMKNCGFSGLKVKRYGIEIHIPQSLINKKTGVPHFHVTPLLKELTKDNILRLEEKGCRVLTAS